MNNTLLHNMNRTHTHIDVENGSFISLPKDGTDYPPVNADINNLITYGKTTGGEGTPAVPVPLVSDSAFNLTSCGLNWFDNIMIAGYYWAYADGVKTSIATLSCSVNLIPVLGNTAFTLARDKMADLGGKSLAVRYYDSNKAYLSGYIVSSAGTNILRFTTPANAYYIGINNDTLDLTVKYMLVQGTYNLSQAPFMPDYTVYTGNTYPYRLEDVNGVLHEAGDLPDGTADTVNWDTGKLVKRIGHYSFTGEEVFYFKWICNFYARLFFFCWLNKFN